MSLSGASQCQSLPSQTVFYRSTVIDPVNGLFSTGSARSLKSGIPTTITVGGSRKLTVDVIASRTVGRTDIKAGAACANCIQDQTLTFSVPTNIIATGTLVWDGSTTSCNVNEDDPSTCPEFTINYRGLGGIDITEGGSHGAFKVTVGASDLNAWIYIYVFESETAISSYRFNPRDIPELLSLRSVSLPFKSFVQAAGASSPANFRNVGAIQMFIEPANKEDFNEASIDLLVDLIETVPLITATKSYEVINETPSDLAGVQVANPGEVVEFTVTVVNPRDALGSSQEGVVFRDDPSTFAPGIFSLIPGSVTGSIVNFGSTTSTPLTVVQGNGPSDTRVIVNVGTVQDGAVATIKFRVNVSPMPCCLPLCQFPESSTQTPAVPAGCVVEAQGTSQGVENGRCYCSSNQGHACEDFTDPINVFNLDASDCVPTDELRTTLTPIDATYVPIYAPSDPSIQKTARVASASAGDVVVFDIVVTNTGSRQSEDLIVTDSIPQQTSFNADQSSAFNCGAGSAGSSCSISIGRLNPGESVSLTLAINVNALSCGGGGINTPARVAASPNQNCTCEDQNLNNNEDDAPVDLVGSPDLSVTKVPTPASIIPGQTIVYAIEYSNLGNIQAQSITITETLAPMTSFAAASSTDGWSCSGNTCTFSIASLNPGATGSVNFGITLAADVPCNYDEVPNTVSIDNTCGDSNPSNNEFSVPVPVTGTPDLGVTKSDGDVSAAPNTVVTYEIRYSNLGTRRAENVVITEQVPAHTTFEEASSTSGWSCSGNTCTFTVGNLETGASGITNFAVRTKSDYLCPDVSTTNTVSITNDCGDSDLLDNSDSEDTPLIGQPNLVITKTADKNQVSTGEVVVFTLNYNNAGVRQATGATITEEILPGFSFVSGQSSAFTCSGASCTLSVGDIAVGGSGTATFALRLDAAVACQSSSLTNTACINNNCGESDQNNNCDSDVVTPVGTPDLKVSCARGSTGPLVPGQTVTFTLSYSNVGTAASTDTVVSSILPAHTTFQADGSNSGWTNAGSIYSINVGALAPQQTGTVMFVVVVNDPLDCGEFETQCSVGIENSCGELNPADNEFSEPSPLEASPILNVEVTDNDAELRQGGCVTYEITYYNSGNRHARNSVLSTSIPENTFYSGSGWTLVDDRYVRNVGDVLAASDDNPTVYSASIDFCLNDPVPRGIDETSINVRIEEDSEECGESSDEDNEPTPIIGNPDLTIRKTDNDIRTKPGETVTYRLIYSNIGDRDATGVVITEVVPPFSAFIADLSTPGWDCPDHSPAGTVCTFDHNAPDGRLAVRDSAEILFTVKLSDWMRCGIDFIGNEVSIADDGENGPEITLFNNRDTEETPVDGEPDLRIWITDNLQDNNRDHRVFGGDIIYYTIHWDNVGLRDAVNVNVSVTVPPYTTFVPEESEGDWECQGDGSAGDICSLFFDELQPEMDRPSEGSAVFAVRVDLPIPAGVKGTTIEASISNDCGDCNIFNNFDDDYTPFVGIPDVFVTEKGFCLSIEWFIEYSNVGDQDAENVVVVETVPVGTRFDAELSDEDWECENNGVAGSVCTLSVGTVTAGQGGSAYFITTPDPSANVTVYENCVDIDRYDTAGNVIEDPTPRDNTGCTMIGLEGCPDKCDSCCPQPTECCPDSTEVLFNFGGILEGIGECRGNESP